MNTEIEAKWLNADHDLLRSLLKSKDAELIMPERLMRRKIFHFRDSSRSNEWVRVRDEGNKITLSHKIMNSRDIHGTKELLIEVDNFDVAVDLLLSLGLIQKSYQETKRETWVLDGATIELDTWPWVPPFVEIEADDESRLKSVADRLGLAFADAKFGSVEPVYQEIYDVTEHDINNWSEIVFSDVPEWLPKHR